MISVERLVRLGLTQYEARAYVALVRRDGSLPAEVARVASVPRPRIYDVIDSLVAKGLASERPGGTAKFVATPPAEAVRILVNSHRERLRMLEADADAVREELSAAFEEGSTHSDPLDYIELIRSPEAVAKRFSELQQSVEREILVFSKMPDACGGACRGKRHRPRAGAHPHVAQPLGIRTARRPCEPRGGPAPHRSRGAGPIRRRAADEAGDH